MKRIALVVMALTTLQLSGCASMALDLDKYSIIDDNEIKTDDAIVRIQVVNVDGHSTAHKNARYVYATNYHIDIETCVVGIGSCFSDFFSCNFLTGYVYKVAPFGCSIHGRRMDFEDADKYWAKIDTDPNRKAAEADAVNKQMRNEEKEAVQIVQRLRWLESNKQEFAAQAAAKLASFRHSLRESSETNCGPVVEIKGNLVKVSHAVANYGNEH